MGLESLPPGLLKGIRKGAAAFSKARRQANFEREPIPGCKLPRILGKCFLHMHLILFLARPVSWATPAQPSSGQMGGKCLPVALRGHALVGPIGL